MHQDKKWLEDAQEKWWNELTEEQQEQVQAEAIMEARKCEELDEMIKVENQRLNEEFRRDQRREGPYNWDKEWLDDVLTADTDDIPW